MIPIPSACISARLYTASRKPGGGEGRGGEGRGGEGRGGEGRGGEGRGGEGKGRGELYKEGHGMEGSLRKQKVAQREDMEMGIGQSAAGK